MRKWIIASILIIVVIASIVMTFSDRFYAPLPAEYAKERKKKAKTEPLIYDDRDFERLGKPSEGEWLSRFDELGQSFEEYKAGRPTKPTGERRYIVLLPIGDFTGGQKEMLQAAAEYCRLYYSCPVRMEKLEDGPDLKFSRQRSYGRFEWTQFRTDHILNDILRPTLPDDAICYLGVIMSDLYPGDSWNFVFGQASIKDRIGVYSLFRYDPEAFGSSETAGRSALILRRSLKVMVHEIGHMFSLFHCIY